MRLQMIGLWGIVERNTYLVRRYFWWEFAFFIWTIANTLTITKAFLGSWVTFTSAGPSERRVLSTSDWMTCSLR